MAPPKRRARLNQPDVFPLISEKHAAAVGYVAIRWAEVEMAIGHLIRTMILLEGPAGYAVTADLPFQAAVNLATVLVDLTGNEGWKAEWAALIAKVEGLRPLRNDATHGEWHAIGEEHATFRSKARKRLVVALKPLGTDTLNKMADDCLCLSTACVSLRTSPPSV